MKTLIANGRVVTPHECIEGGWVLIDGARIAAVGQGPEAAADRRIDAAGRCVAPGFIDLHVQGFEGIDLWDPSEEAYVEATRRMARTGVTAFGGSVDATPQVCRLMRPRMGRADGGSRLAGLYFESPFISPERRGAIPASRVAPATPERVEEVLEMARGMLALVTVAPELDGALDLVRRLRAEAGPAAPVVAALGHTAATFEQAAAGLAAGMTHCTHLYNAMTGLHHRDPGCVGALLTHPTVTVELVCDGVHLHPAAVCVALACTGPARACLITDAVSGRRGTVVGGAPRLEDGTIAGSVLSMDRAVANVRRFAGVSLADAVRMATLTPASVIGQDATRGRLAAGCEADIALFDDDIRVSMTLVGGEVVHGEA
jgi:N-acetylglucosamine-6-phosphate deacetylase